MPDSNLNTSISAMRTAILNDLPTATVAELVDLSRAAKSLNLGNDSTVETAINNRAVALINAGANQAEIIKISQAVKSVLSPATFANNIANITTITSSLVPDTDVAYDLGTSSNRFNDIYLDGSTIDLGGQTIKSTATGIEVSEITIGSGTNKVKLSANSSGKLEQVGTNSGGVVQDTVTGSGPASTAVTNLSDLTAISSPATGQSVLVTSTNKLYIYNGTGWYLIAEVTNLSPTAITGLNATYDLAIDGTATTITLNSTDPEGATLTWSHAITTGTLGSTATITNVDNVFTITPSTTEADAGSFSVTFSASDGSQAATSVSAFTLAFGWPDISNFDISNASYDNLSFSVASQEYRPYGLAFNSDGTKMFVIGTGSDRVYQYSLTNGFSLAAGNVTYDNLNFSVSSQDGTPTGISFNSDGTKMFVIGGTNDSIYQYSLTNGFSMAAGNVTYDNLSFSVSSQETEPYSTAFNSDGTKMFVVGANSDRVYQYSLTNGFSLAAGNVTYDNLSFELAVTGQGAASGFDIEFDPSGTKMFVISFEGDRIYQYSLTNGFSMAAGNVTYDSMFGLGSQGNNPTSVAFNTNGTKMFVTNSDGDSVHQYSF